ncbi:MAG TPA: ABC transporter permease [Acholeplasma sp.]|nr:ABC transporter permease [Acholeplasma sp.]
MKHILIVMRKELARVFTDKKLIFTTIILPGLLLFVVYSLIGSAMSQMVEPEKAYDIYEYGLTSEVRTVLVTAFTEAEMEVNFISVTESEIEGIKNDIESEDKLLLIHMDPDTKEIYLYYNDGNMDSLGIQSSVLGILNAVYNQTIINGVQYKILEQTFSKNDLSFNLVAMILPMLIITFLFQGALAVGPESIAGDKERGTIATLLSTPTRRSHIALGKIFSLSILSVLSSISSFIGVILSLPKLMQSDTSITFDFSTYVTLFLILVSTTLVIISIVSVISATAKNIKEATTFVTPLMILSMMIGMTTMFSFKISDGAWTYAIPIYNTANILSEAFTGNINLVPLVVAVVSNLLFTVIFAFILTKMFNSEKMMFTK